MDRMTRRLVTTLAVLAGLLTSAAATAAATPASASTTCTAQLGGGCGPYTDTGFWPGSDGYNTYVGYQSFATSGSTGTLNATGPGNWNFSGNFGDCGGCVQAYPDAQQLTNNWNDAAKNFTGSANMKLSDLSRLQVVYAESSPTDPGDQYEFAPDLWTNYGDDIMMWADTSTVTGSNGSRCDNNGLGAGNIIGQVTLLGQPWTVYSYGRNDEIVFVLDGVAGDTDPIDDNTCAHQTSGTLPVLAALKWVSAHRSVTGAPAWQDQRMKQLNVGWEQTYASGGTFSVSSLRYNVTIK